eukprot:364938-Chlamydomonas_euryale.AAC.41
MLGLLVWVFGLPDAGVGRSGAAMGLLERLTAHVRLQGDGVFANDQFVWATVCSESLVGFARVLNSHLLAVPAEVLELLDAVGYGDNPCNVVVEVRSLRGRGEGFQKGGSIKRGREQKQSGAKGRE